MHIIIRLESFVFVCLCWFYANICIQYDLLFGSNRLMVLKPQFLKFSLDIFLHLGSLRDKLRRFCRSYFVLLELPRVGLELHSVSVFIGSPVSGLWRRLLEHPDFRLPPVCSVQSRLPNDRF